MAIIIIVIAGFIRIICIACHSASTNNALIFEKVSSFPVNQRRKLQRKLYLVVVVRRHVVSRPLLWHLNIYSLFLGIFDPKQSTTTMENINNDHRLLLFFILASVFFAPPKVGALQFWTIGEDVCGNGGGALKIKNLCDVCTSSS
jgi:hypothetical protein